MRKQPHIQRIQFVEVFSSLSQNCYRSLVPDLVIIQFYRIEVCVGRESFSVPYAIPLLLESLCLKEKETALVINFYLSLIILSRTICSCYFPGFVGCVTV